VSKLAGMSGAYKRLLEENELHRCTHDGGKQVAEVFDHGTLGEGMRAAIEEIKSGYEEVIDGWHRA
jgi:hypothetical protein